MNYQSETIRSTQHLIYRHTYEGCSINKLQNSIILLVFQILTIQNICFVGNLIPSSSYEFYDDDGIVTSFINIEILP